MNSAAITALLQLILSFLGGVITNAQVDQIITVLEAWLPTIIQTVPEVVSGVTDIITYLRGSNQLTPDQIARLDALTAQIDAAADAALEQAMKDTQP